MVQVDVESGTDSVAVIDGSIDEVDEAVNVEVESGAEVSVGVIEEVHEATDVGVKVIVKSEELVIVILGAVVERTVDDTGMLDCVVVGEFVQVDRGDEKIVEVTGDVVMIEVETIVDETVGDVGVVSFVEVTGGVVTMMLVDDCGIVSVQVDNAVASIEDVIGSVVVGVKVIVKVDGSVNDEPVGGVVGMYVDVNGVV